MKINLYSIITLLFFGNVVFTIAQNQSNLVISVTSETSITVTTKNFNNLEIAVQSESSVQAIGNNKANLDVDPVNATVGNFLIQRLNKNTVIFNTMNNYKIDIEPLSNSVILVKNHL